jgi:hypothetical protein
MVGPIKPRFQIAAQRSARQPRRELTEIGLTSSRVT